MKDVLDFYINKSLSTGGDGVFQAQIRFKRDGFTAAGAVKHAQVKGFYELLTVGEDHTKRGGGKVGVVLIFDPEEVGYVGMQYEVSPVIKAV